MFGAHPTMRLPEQFGCRVGRQLRDALDDRGDVDAAAQARKLAHGDRTIGIANARDQAARGVGGLAQSPALRRFGAIAQHPVLAPLFRPLLAPFAACCLLAAVVLRAQDPAPLIEPSRAAQLRSQGERLLDEEDPLAAWRAFRAALDEGGAAVASGLGLGRAHLMLGNSPNALAYAESALREQPGSQEAMALCVRALIRARRFDDAVQRSSAFVARTEAPLGELLAARGSALFRVQRIDEAAAVYTKAVALEPLHPEAHLRLGSGLLPPAVLSIPPTLQQAVAAAGRGDRAVAIEGLLAVLHDAPEHAIAHRLLGEVV